MLDGGAFEHHLRCVHVMVGGRGPGGEGVSLENGQVTLNTLEQSEPHDQHHSTSLQAHLHGQEHQAPHSFFCQDLSMPKHAWESPCLFISF